MFDDLRQKSAEEAEFLNAEDPEETVVATTTTKTVKTRAARPKAVRRRASGGLTPMQGFVLALMLFLNVSVLGFFALLVFEKIALPFF